MQNGSMVIAVPSEDMSGLEAPRSAHFGRAAAFTLVEVVDGAVVSSRALANPPHTHGGCMNIVALLQREGVTAVAAVGMGGGPLNGLRAAGIDVYFDPESSTVREAAEAVAGGKVGPFGGEHACAGH